MSGRIEVVTLKARRAVTSLVLVACAALAGCASATQAAAPADEWPEPHYLGAVVETTTYYDGMISLAPPRADDPAADESVWRAAYEQQCPRGEAICRRELTPDIVYTRATVTGALNAIDPADNEVATPTIADRLVYVIRYNEGDGNQCIQFGPAPPEGVEPSGDPTFPCTTINFIDAATGKGLGTIG